MIYRHVEERLLMKLVLAPFAMILILFQFLPFGGSPQEKPEEKPPVKGWWVVSTFSVSPTRYSSIGGRIIKAESRGSRASLFRKVGEKEKDFPVLSWRWKISNVVRSAIETRKDRFDAAARVMVVFGKESPFGLVGEGEPSGMKIEYIWASRLPRGKSFRSSGRKEHQGDCPGVRRRKSRAMG